jgi:hypothetical protein
MDLNTYNTTYSYQPQQLDDELGAELEAEFDNLNAAFEKLTVYDKNVETDLSKTVMLIEPEITVRKIPSLAYFTEVVNDSDGNDSPLIFRTEPNLVEFLETKCAGEFNTRNVNSSVILSLIKICAARTEYIADNMFCFKGIENYVVFASEHANGAYAELVRNLSYENTVIDRTAFYSALAIFKESMCNDGEILAKFLGFSSGSINSGGNNATTNGIRDTMKFLSNKIIPHKCPDCRSVIVLREELHHCNCDVNNPASIKKLMVWYGSFIKNSTDKVYNMQLLSGIIRARLIELITFDASNRSHDGFNGHAYILFSLTGLFIELSKHLVLLASMRFISL